VLPRFCQLLGLVLDYQRRAARSESRNGGAVPVPELGGLLSGWAREALALLRLEVRLQGGHSPLRTPAILVGNLLGVLDIPVLRSLAPVVLVGKAEIARWPNLGTAGRRAGMVFVQRDSDGSRQQAARAIAACLRGRGMGIGLFPAGTTSLDEARPWRPGGFRIAREAGFPVQLFRLSYDPAGPAAFVGTDCLVPHLHRLLKSPRSSPPSNSARPA